MSVETENPAIVEPSTALESMERASIDQQVSTAHRFPRSVKQFLADARDMVTVDLDTAEGCFFRLERKDDKAPDGIKVIEGPSVRLLEIAASCYGNIRYGARVIGMDDKFVIAQGVAHDLQKNVYSSTEVRRRITTKSGHRYGDDMLGVTSNAACAIAKRNALNGVVPRVYINQLCDLARETARGTNKTLSERRARALAYFADKLGVKQEKVLARLKRAGIEEITLDDLEILNGLKTAIKEGETTIDEEFNPKPDAPKAGLGDIIGKPADKAKDAAPPPPQAGNVSGPAGTPTTNAPPAGAPPPPAAKQYTAEQRATFLKEVEDAMLMHGMSEAKLLKHAKSIGLGKEGQDEVSALDTAALDQLRTIIPTMKKAG